LPLGERERRGEERFKKREEMKREKDKG